MENINVKDSRMASLIVLYDMHTTYFGNAIAGISDEDAHNRLSTNANHVAWLTGSLVEQRFEITNMLGYHNDRKPVQAAHELFKNNKGIQDEVTYPSLTEFKKDWEIISPLLREALLNVSGDKLGESFEMMPGMKMTYYDLITFVIYREANIIGQIALWRRLLGYEAMKYM
ncbi:MAG: DinB family protein [Bacteroidota bacterium]|nr:DinB family protein [Bacteroidota bacterium]MDQ6890708.1 DinB family protein [Bacteroidota bacterium]